MIGFLRIMLDLLEVDLMVKVLINNFLMAFANKFFSTIVTSFFDF
jgi:hypothetical protein